MNRLTPIAALCSVLPLAALAHGDDPRDVPTDGAIEGWHGDGNFARTGIMYALYY